MLPASRLDDIDIRNPSDVHSHSLLFWLKRLSLDLPNALEREVNLTPILSHLVEQRRQIEVLQDESKRQNQLLERLLAKLEDVAFETRQVPYQATRIDNSSPLRADDDKIDHLRLPTAPVSNMPKRRRLSVSEIPSSSPLQVPEEAPTLTSQKPEKEKRRILMSDDVALNDNCDVNDIFL